MYLSNELKVWSPNVTLCQEYQVCHVYHCSIAEKREELNAEGCRSWLRQERHPLFYGWRAYIKRANVAYAPRVFADMLPLRKSGRKTPTRGGVPGRRYGA